MNNNTIIDIEPIEASGSQKTRAEQEPAPEHVIIEEGSSPVGASYALQDSYVLSSGGMPSSASCNTQGAYGTGSAGANSSSRVGNRTYTVMYSTRRSSEKKPRRLMGLVQIVFGLLCALIGIPLLILPGPGLLMILAGLALVASGFRRLFGFGSSNGARVNNQVV